MDGFGSTDIYAISPDDMLQRVKRDSDVDAGHW